jgi:dTDP-4-dehydrorhamnose 3,5-epimerase
VEFVQDNHSRSQRGVLRGLHYQLPPHPRASWCAWCGAVFDVAVDIRRGSPDLRALGGRRTERRQPPPVVDPQGFAHGFLALEDDTHFLYKTTDCERAIYAQRSPSTAP